MEYNIEKYIWPRSSVRLEYWPFKPGVAGSNPVEAISTMKKKTKKKTDIKKEAEERIEEHEKEEEERKTTNPFVKIASEIVTTVGLVVSMFLLSTNFTGFAVANLDQGSMNTIGAASFVIALIAAYFWVKK